MKTSVEKAATELESASAATLNREEQGAANRERFLDQAAELFAHKGYRQCGVQEIIDTLHLSKGGFYWYFKSKEDLYCQICERHCEQHRALFQQVLQQGPVNAHAILDASRNLLERFLSNPDEVRLTLDFHLESGSNEIIRSRLHALGAAWQAILSAVIQRAMEVGLIPGGEDPQVVARLCLTFFEGLLLEFVIERNREAAMLDWERFLIRLFGRGTGE